MAKPAPSTNALLPPQKVSEVKAWLAQNAGLSTSYETLAWAPGRKYAVHAACVRALTTLATPEALDAFATYRGRDAGNMSELGDAWDRFDRAEFARRVLSSPAVLSARGGLKRIDGIEHVEGLDRLVLETAARCSLAPLAGCPGLVSLEITTRGDLDLSPIAALPSLDRCTLHGSSKITKPSGLAGAAMRKLAIGIGPEVTWDVLERLPRLRRALLTSERESLGGAERSVLRRLVSRGVAVCAYRHEAWSAALAELPGFVEAFGFRAAGPGDHLPSLSSGNFLG